MIKPDDPILIIGAGSIGERHIRNLLALGYRNLIVYRQRNLPFRTINFEQVRVITDFGQIEIMRPKAAFITSPTAQHLPQAIACARLGMHLFIEKPLSHSLEGLSMLQKTVEEKGVYVYVGYMMRFHPLIGRLKEIIEARCYGKLLSFSTRWGEYLPDWHPWEDYRTSYAARKEMGGGAALTLSHDLDLVLWLAGSPLVNHYALPNRASALEVDVEAGMDFLLQFESGTTGHVHLNFFEKPPARYLHYVFESAVVHFDYYTNELQIATSDETKTLKKNQFDRNQLFIDQTLYFFNKIQNFDLRDSLAEIENSERIIKMCAPL
jgi:predicted dehydrogenase